MAKHPHRLLLNHKKTWRCTLPGCKYFIHIGLAHILPGSSSVCWNCSGVFTLDERALSDDQPICDDCNASKQGLPTSAEIERIIEEKIALGKQGVKTVEELPPNKRRMLENFGVIPRSPSGTNSNETTRTPQEWGTTTSPENDVSVDEIEVYDPTDE